MTALDLLLKGGWVMVPMLLLSILAGYAILERMWVLNQSIKPSSKWLNDIYAKILSGDIQEVKMLCKQKNNAVARVLNVGTENLIHTPGTIEMVMETAGKAEIYKLEKNLFLLGTIAGAAPMLGFLGTVIGMIQTFMAIAKTTTQVNPQLLSVGIYQAMITTAAGLVVGIIADLSYKYLLARVQAAAYHIEQAASQFIELVQYIPQEQLDSKIHEA